MVSEIHEEILQAMVDFHARSSEKATKIYLGRTQKRRLMCLADKWRIRNAEIANIKGEHRLEFMGLSVYEVNDDEHCVVA